MSKEINIKLGYGEIKIDLNIKGVSGSSAEKAVDEIFELFKSKLAKPRSIREAYSDMAALKPEEPKNSVSTAEDSSTVILTANKAADVPVGDINEPEDKEESKLIVGAVAMEELLKGVNPLSYRVYGDVYRFQTYYICDNCCHKGRAFVERRPSFKCRECGKTMKLIPATNEKFPHVDCFGNFYVAGKYKQNSVYVQEQENKAAEEVVYTFMLEEEMANQREEDRPKKLQTK